MTWEIEPRDDGVCLLTVVHDQLEGSPKTAASVSGEGWMRVLSGLKTLLETGQPDGRLRRCGRNRGAASGVGTACALSVSQRRCSRSRRPPRSR